MYLELSQVLKIFSKYLSPVFSEIYHVTANVNLMQTQTYITCTCSKLHVQYHSAKYGSKINDTKKGC